MIISFKIRSRKSLEIQKTLLSGPLFKNLKPSKKRPRTSLNNVENVVKKKLKPNPQGIESFLVKREPLKAIENQ